MKRNLGIQWLAILALGVSMASCLKSEDVDNSQYKDCDITSFSVGDIATIRHTTTKTGKDSTYTETLKGDSIKWEIDQVAGKIYNPDSLPVGTNIKRIVPTISASGLVARDSLGILKYFNNGADSLDFTKGQTFTVVAYNNTDKRSYQVEVRVHKMDPDQWTWDSIPSVQYAGNAFVKGQKALEKNGVIYVFGTADGQTTGLTTSTDGRTWTAIRTLNKAVDYSTVLNDGNTFYGKTTDGMIYKSADGVNWTQAFTTGERAYSLLYIDQTKLYIATDSKTMKAIALADGTSTAISAENDAVYPASQVYGFDKPGAVIAEDRRQVFVGLPSASVAADTAAVAWTRSGNDDWIYTGTVGSNPGKYACPAFANLAVFAYGDKKLVAFGSDAKARQRGFSDVYVSEDWGVTWYPTKNKNVFPAAFHEDAVRRDNAFSFIIKDKRIWIFWSKPVKGASVWRGNLNKVNFLRK